MVVVARGGRSGGQPHILQNPPDYRYRSTLSTPGYAVVVLSAPGNVSAWISTTHGIVVLLTPILAFYLYLLKYKAKKYNYGH